MKKALSLILAITVIAATFICALPSAAAAEKPIKATPLEIAATQRGWQYVAGLETVTPLTGFTTAQGLLVKQNESYSSTNPHESADGAVANNGRYVMYNYDQQNILFGASDGLIIYVKTDAANQIALNVSGNVEHTPKVGANYKYAALGDTSWQTAQFVTGLADATDRGAVNFGAAFEGYIKIPYSSLSGSFNPETENVIQIVFRFKGLGENHLETSDSTTVYGTATVGPIFVVTSDSESTEIEVPNDWKTAPIEATPITDWTKTYVPGITRDVITPLGTVNADGILASAADNTVSDSGDGNSATASKYLGMTMNSPYSLADTDGFIMYIKTDAANQLSFSFAAVNTETGNTFGWDGNAHAAKGRNFYVLAKGSNTWVKMSFTDGTKDTTPSYAYKAAIKFDDAFEGYVKIPYASLGVDRTGFTTFSDAYSLSAIVCRFRGLGVIGDIDYGKVLLGPVSTYKTDTGSTSIKYPDDLIPAPVKVKPMDISVSGYNKSSGITMAETAVGILPETGFAISSETEKGSDTEFVGNAPAGYAGAIFAQEQNLGGTTGVMLYIKTDSANSIAPEFGSAGFGWGSVYGSMGSAYYYMPAGGDSWLTATFGRGKENENAYGTIDFDGAFEGYIKIPYSSLYNSRSGFGLGKFDPEKYTFSSIYLRSRYLGGEHNYIAGPMYLITSDSSSCEFEVEREDITADLLPKDYYSQGIGEKLTDESGNSVYENGRLVLKNIGFDDTDNGGFKISSKTDAAVEAEDGKIGRANTVGMLADYQDYPLAINGSEGIMLYVELPAANVVSPTVTLGIPKTGWDRNYNPEMGLKPGSYIYTLSDGDSEWAAMQVQNVSSNESYFGGLVFEKGFKGWIKLPFNKLNNDYKSTTVAPDTDTIQGIALRFKGVGGEYGDITVSKIALMRNNSLSAVITAADMVFSKGDVNHDGKIDVSDLAVLRKHLLGAAVKRCCEPNVRGEEQTDIRDLVRLKKQIAG